MIEKQCERCGKSMVAKSKQQRFCEDCVKEKRKINNKKRHQKESLLCNPPFDCINGKCPYDDCIRDGGITKAENQIIRDAKLNSVTGLLLINDVVYRY